MRLAWVCALLASCVRSSEVTCADGRICPPGNTCDDANHRCLSPEQVAACNGHPEGDACTLATVSGVCHDGVCEPLVCGDGVRTGTELCDGSDLGGADCTTAGFYEPAGLACTPFCTFDTSQCLGFCGDGIVDGPELCDGAPPQAACIDEGFDAGALQCSTSCGASFVGCGRFNWRPELTGVPLQTGITGTSSTDLWSVGTNGSDGIVGHFDGAAWTTETIAPGKNLVAIAQAAPGDVWAIGTSAVMHLAAGQWGAASGVPTATYKDVAALASDLVLVATTTGLLEWNGTAWQPVGSLTASLITVRGTSASDLWVAQSDGTLQHWNGAAWQAATVTVHVRRIHALTPTDVWVAGTSFSGIGNATAHWNGATWTTFSDNLLGSTQALLALADNDVWVAYNSGTLRHYDGLRWTTITSAPGGSTGGFGQMLAFGGELVAVTTDSLAYRYTGQLYARSETGETFAANAVWSDAPDDVYYTDSRGNVVHFDGATWTSTSVAAKSLVAIWGTGPNDLWAGSIAGDVFHYTGTSWLNVASLIDMTAIWGSGPSDVWLGGASVTHYDGSTFTSSLAVAAAAIAGSGPNDVWAAAQVVGGSDIYHWDGTAWSGAMHLSRTVTALVVLAPDSVYATADLDHILHYDGSTWSDTQVLALTGLRFASATAPDDVFVASPSEIFQFDGSRWSKVRAPSDAALAGETIAGLLAHRGWIDLMYSTATSTQQLRQLVRTRPWNCRAKETDCSDGVDDDCDGKVDGLDPDCP